MVGRSSLALASRLPAAPPCVAARSSRARRARDIISCFARVSSSGIKRGLLLPSADCLVGELHALQGRRGALNLVEHDANDRREGISSLSLSLRTHDHSPETLALSLAQSLSRACACVRARSLSPAPRAARLLAHASRPLRLAALLAPLARAAREICRSRARCRPIGSTTATTVVPSVGFANLSAWCRTTCSRPPAGTRLPSTRRSKPASRSTCSTRSSSRRRTTRQVYHSLFLT